MKIITICIYLFFLSFSFISMPEVSTQELQKDTCIYGQVYEENAGNVLEGTEIRVFSKEHKLLAKTLTNNKGEFKLCHFLAGEYLITANLDGFEQSKQEILLKTNEPIIVNLGLRVLVTFDIPGYIIAGKILEKNNKSVKKAEISIRDALSSELLSQTYTNYNGKYKIQLFKSCQMILSVYKQGFKIVLAHPTPLKFDNFLFNPNNSTYKIPDLNLIPMGIELKKKPSCISGKITDETGVPISNATIFVINGAKQYFIAKEVSNTDGQYKVNLKEYDQIILIVGKPSFSANAKVIHFDIDEKLDFSNINFKLASLKP